MKEKKKKRVIIPEIFCGWEHCLKALTNVESSPFSPLDGIEEYEKISSALENRDTRHGKCERNTRGGHRGLNCEGIRPRYRSQNDVVPPQFSHFCLPERLNGRNVLAWQINKRPRNERESCLLRTYCYPLAKNDSRTLSPSASPCPRI